MSINRYNTDGEDNATSESGHHDDIDASEMESHPRVAAGAADGDEETGDPAAEDGGAQSEGAPSAVGSNDTAGSALGGSGHTTKTDRAANGSSDERSSGNGIADTELRE